MMVRSHVIVGVASWVGLAPLLALPAGNPVFLALSVLGALLPDLDHPKSWVGRRTRPLSNLLAFLLGHRGITHSAFAVVGLVWLLAHFGLRRGDVLALAVGYASHLAADLLTPRGLPLAWPFKRTWSLPLCRTGSAMEPLVVVLLAGGVAWWRWRHPAW